MKTAVTGNSFRLSFFVREQLELHKRRPWKIFDDIPDLVQTRFEASYVYYVDPVMYLRALLDCIDARPGPSPTSIRCTGR